ncbi:GNAT family N-acetyltransferase [Actinomadura namibiensis]|uniref:GNAT superfamily N-acetyltransferase n=1 Tax=Actinomadura namibiensis TaxID=182080 RepID=A0A7W3LSS5_ACTNM|nr:GNAT family N-acetyltransferase [Actinomadura namibiensis]MBA8953537.1 GNAT superfamily N-acetyltransferase [Actinomadura namibiensis]
MREPWVREIDRRAFLRRLRPILEVYAAAMRPPPEQLPGRHTIMERHASYPRFRALVAERRPAFPGLPGTVRGFAYGFHGERGQWWHDVVHQALERRGGPGHAARWLSDAFEVAELHVHPEAQGQGLGRGLLTGLCEGRPETTVVLSTLDGPEDSPARRLYRSVGLVDLLTDFEFPGGGPRYAVMGGRLPLAPYPDPASSS